jgi:hypothetical protein
LINFRESCPAWICLSSPANSPPTLRRSSVGPYSTESTTINTGIFQNRLNPSTNVIFSLGKHTLVAGGGYSYTQLNIENNRNGIAQCGDQDLRELSQGEVVQIQRHLTASTR